ncbi:hypothetical protein BH11MYX4_BH11MYX4_42310 [soil metagenome]
MKKLRLVAFLSVGCAFVAAAPLAACSDDTSVNPTTDGGGTPDSPSGDATTDTNVTDAAPDTAEVDAGLTVATVADVVSAHMCTALARCCFGNPNPPDGGVDGGTWDRAACLKLYADLGFENSSVGHTLFTGGKVSLDQAKAVDCLAKIDALTCSLSGAVFQDIRTTCFAAIKGLATAGQACEQSVECAAGLFCDPTTPGGALTGKCAALKTNGQGCGLFTASNPGVNSIKSEEACSYRGSGAPALFCDSYDFVADNYTDATTWTCKPAVANGQSCNDSTWCSSGICDPSANFKCVSPAQYFQGGSCTGQVTP